MTARDEIRAQRGKMAGKALAGFAVIAAIAGLAIAIAAIMQKPNIEGILGGILGGGFLALLIMGAGAWISMRIAAGPPPPPDLSAGDEIASALKDVLAELEKARLATVGEINRRAGWRVPLCAVGGILLWFFGQSGDDPGDIGDLVAMIVVGAIAGYLWAAYKLSNQYTRTYKNTVLPKLAASFGDISYRHALMPDLEQLKEECIFRNFDHATADDELHGNHRGLPINIVELKLQIRQGENDQTVFDGLLVTLELARDTNAVTAVVSDVGMWGNFSDRMKAQHRERVRLEDINFEKVYETYSTDQIAARALLHPAFMEKLLALGSLSDFQTPLVLCSGRTLQIAMPKRMGRDLFEPPSFQNAAASRDSLTQLRKDIEAVLAAADAVIDLDHRFAVKPLQP